MKSRNLICILSLLFCLTCSNAGYSQSAKGEPAADGITAELKMHEGRSTLFINGEPHDGIFCSTRPGNKQNFIDAGFDIFNIMGGGHGWIADGVYDYLESDEYSMDNNIEAFLAEMPDAKIIPRLGFAYPRNFWWAVQNVDQQAVPHGRDLGRKMPSYASLKWRKEAGEALRNIVMHLEKKYGNSIIGYLPGCGSCGEWFQWHAYTEITDRFTNGYQLGDYSQPMQEAYRAYVKEKYQSIS